MKRGIWIFGMIAIGFIAVFAFTMATMYLWNWLVPELFAGKVINFWQALGLLALSKILFSGFGKGRGHHGGHWRSHWGSRWQDKMRSMSPEDQERFKEKMIRLKYKMEDKWCGPAKKSSDVDSGETND